MGLRIFSGRKGIFLLTFRQPGGLGFQRKQGAPISIYLGAERCFAQNK